MEGKKANAMSDLLDTILDFTNVLDVIKCRTNLIN